MSDELRSGVSESRVVREVIEGNEGCEQGGLRKKRANKDGI